MIVKLCSPGHNLIVEADNVTESLCEGGYIDVRVNRGGHEVYRAIVSDKPLPATPETNHPTFNRGYVMEGGKTVDRIQP